MARANKSEKRQVFEGFFLLLSTGGKKTTVVCGEEKKEPPPQSGEERKRKRERGESWIEPEVGKLPKITEIKKDHLVAFSRFPLTLKLKKTKKEDQDVRGSGVILQGVREGGGEQIVPCPEL